MHHLLPNLQKLQELGVIESYPENPDLEYVASLAEDLEVTIDQLLYEQVEADTLDEKIEAVQMLVMDCDGVLTDGGMYLTKKGDEIKRFNAKDGQGIRSVQNRGMRTGIISAGISTGLVEKRAEMLDIDKVYVGSRSKLEVLEEWLAELNLSLEQVAYIGDDLKDVAVLERVGLACCPADAIFAAKQAADIVLETNGGAGCIRELVDAYLLANR